jgi:galactose mutarotase-like enzyme
MQQHRIAAGHLSAAILARGAEPTSIAHDVAGEVLWQAGPAWPKHAPVLFPIVGELKNGAYTLGGKTYAMARHGFARERDFTWMETGTTACTLLLRDDERTRDLFPFPFELQIRYAIADDELVITYTVRNPGAGTLPASLGAHPAFAWPIAAGIAKDAHVLTFASDEPEPIRRLRDNLLDPAPFPTPIHGRDLALDPSLFDADAIVMDRIHSTSVRYGAPGAPTVDIAWTGFEQLGIWSKRGGDFVCIEPWYGYASPADFDGDFTEKPGLMHVAPGEERSFEIRIRIEAP